jgi:hypothetical protein
VPAVIDRAGLEGERLSIRGPNLKALGEGFQVLRTVTHPRTNAIIVSTMAVPSRTALGVLPSTIATVTVDPDILYQIRLSRLLIAEREFP